MAAIGVEKKTFGVEKKYGVSAATDMNQLTIGEFFSRFLSLNLAAFDSAR